MPTYTVNPTDGTQYFPTRNSGDLYHDFAIRVAGDTPVGTLTLKARKAGSDVYEDIPDGSFDLSSLNTIQFTGGVAEYEVTISGISGITSITMTDTSQGA